MRFAAVAALSAAVVPAIAFATGEVILTFLLGAAAVALIVVGILASDMGPADDEPVDDEQMELFHAAATGGEAGNGGFTIR